MARGGAVTGPASAPLPEYPVVLWTCACGDSIGISQTPTALHKGKYKHIRCGGFYSPEPGREETETC